MKMPAGKLLLLSLVILLLFTPLTAQNKEKKAWINGFCGGGVSHSDYGSDGYIHPGIGGDILIAGGFGLGGEIGFIHFPGTTNNGTLLSLGGIYAFKPERRTVPFLTGGYVGFVGDGISAGAYLGGGIMHFLGDHLGIRLEARDQIYSDNWGGDYHYLEARGGIVLAWD